MKVFLLNIHFKNYSSMKHFTLHELTRSTTATLQGIDNTPPAEAVHRLELLVEHVLDPLREAWGKPIHVSSGYRCPVLNKAVGGAPASQHMRGEAADISVGNPADNRRLYHLLHTLKLPVDQAINEYDFFVDTCVVWSTHASSVFCHSINLYYLTRYDQQQCNFKSRLLGLECGKCLAHQAIAQQAIHLR